MKNGIEVIITVESSIKVKGEEDQTYKFITEGIFYYKDGGKYLIYEEGEIQDVEKTKVTLKIKDRKAQMLRHGGSKGNLRFVKGEELKSIYGTPYGNFDMITKTKRLIDGLLEDGNGTVKIEYDLEIIGLSKSKNTIEISSRVK